MSIAGLTIRWKNLCLDAQVKNQQTKEMETKHILKKINGTARPGELLIIMGPSGAGKSSFMDCIAGRNKQSTGSITVNGSPWNNQIAKLAAYVLQDDLFYETLTVREHLLFQAQLRIGKKKSKLEQEQRVDDVMAELGLTKTRDTFIGGVHIRGISGGERKRLSFATELLTNPSVLFCDEPTSGLDSYMAETVVIQMQQLARGGRTVIGTIHQPSSEIFALFDQLLLLSNGSLVYHGKASSSVEYFSSIGYPCPSYMNPTDYFMKQMALKDQTENEKERLNILIKSWTDVAPSNSPEKNKIIQNKQTSDLEINITNESLRQETNELNVLSENAKNHLSFISTFYILCKRNLTRLIRDKIAFKARIGQTIIIALLVGLIFRRLSISQSGIQNFSGALFFIMVNQVFGSASPEFMTIPSELQLILRESRARLYSAGTWFLAKNISEIINQLIFPFLFTLIHYFIIGFGNDVITFFTFVGITILVASSSTALGYLVSCVTGKEQTAMILGPVCILPFLLFGGLLLNTKDSPVYLVWLKYLSPIRYGYEALSVTFWNTIDLIPCSKDVCLAKNGKQVLTNLGFKNISVLNNCLALVGINIGFRILAGVALWFQLGGAKDHCDAKKADKRKKEIEKSTNKSQNVMPTN